MVHSCHHVLLRQFRRVAVGAHELTPRALRRRRHRCAELGRRSVHPARLEPVRHEAVEQRAVLGNVEAFLGKGVAERRIVAAERPCKQQLDLREWNPKLRRSPPPPFAVDGGGAQLRKGQAYRIQ